MRPLYTALDGVPELPLPGQWPFARGGDARRDVLSGWKVAEQFPLAASGTVRGQRRTAAGALTEGTSALVVRVGDPSRGGAPAAELDRLLDGVLPRSRAGGAGRGCRLRRPPPMRCWRCHRRLRRRPARPAVAGSGCRPADRTAERTRAAAAVDDVAAIAARDGRSTTGVRAVTVDGPALHNLGASASWELAGAIAAGVELPAAADRGRPDASPMRCARSVSGSPPTTTSS